MNREETDMHTTYNKMMNNLEALNLSVFRENLPQYLDMISLGEKSVTDALYELTEKERQFRDEKAIITQIHKSALPSGKSVDGYLSKATRTYSLSALPERERRTLRQR